MKNALGVVVGDHINVRVGALYAQPSNKRRIVRDIDCDGNVLVHLGGNSRFIVSDKEITSITRKG
jgi:hypothetical protein